MVVHEVVIVPDRSCQVRCGVYGIEVAAGTRVGDVRAQYQALWMIPSGAVASISPAIGVTDDYVLQPGEVVTFHRKP